MQDSLDDDASAGNDVPNRPDSDTPKDDFGGGVPEEDAMPMDSEYIDNSPQAYNDRKREPVGARMPFPNSVSEDIPDRDGVLPSPPEPPVCNAGSSVQTREYPDGDFSGGYEERYSL